MTYLDEDFDALVCIEFGFLRDLFDPWDTCDRTAPWWQLVVSEYMSASASLAARKIIKLIIEKPKLEIKIRIIRKAKIFMVLRLTCTKSFLYIVSVETSLS